VASSTANPLSEGRHHHQRPAGILGNLIGFVRVAITAYLLSPYAHADALGWA
jgi:hypothetical protein